MASLKPLFALRATALKSLAVSLGVNSSGTKSELVSRIVSACCEPVPFFERSHKKVQQGCLDVSREEEEEEGKMMSGKREKRVLSIDMGIRNLAMCVLEVPTRGVREVAANGKQGIVTESLPTILAWERVTFAENPMTKEETSPTPSEEAISNPNDTTKEDDKNSEVQPEGPLTLPEEGSTIAVDGAEQGEGGGKRTRGISSEELPAVLEDETSGPDDIREKEADRIMEKNQPEESIPVPFEEDVLVLNKAGKKKRARPKKVQPKEQETPQEVSALDNAGEVESLQKEVSGSEGLEKKIKRRTKKTQPETPDSLLSNPYSAPFLDFEEIEEAEVVEKKERKRVRKPKKPVESFEPSVYALLANTFVHQLLDRFSPIDAILIERQRYRSHGATAIQEWTVRVNMLEAMFHAIFYCLHGKASPAAKSVRPDRVTRFWVDRVGEKYLEVKKKAVRKKKKDLEGSLADEMGLEEIAEVTEEAEGREKTYKKTKLAKISLVTEWLNRGDIIMLGEEVRTVASDFTPRVNGRGRLQKSNSGKLDDLADCLLQAMAWIRWEENRRSLAEGKLIPEFVSCENSKS